MEWALIMAEKGKLNHSSGFYTESLGKTASAPFAAGGMLVIHNGGLVDCVRIGIGAAKRSDEQRVYICVRG
ncbi:MAG: hypothetical protein LIO46_04480 [Clostridiales bacterium]|nr:hypothetical protein [Clostridiales bacterium]